MKYHFLGMRHGDRGTNSLHPRIISKRNFFETKKRCDKKEMINEAFPKYGWWRTTEFTRTKLLEGLLRNGPL